MRLFKKSFLKFLKISFCMLLLILPLVILKIYEPQSFVSLENFIAGHGLFFRLLRWLFIIVFISSWRFWINLYARKYRWSDERRNFFISQRWRMAVWLVVFELLVCENVLASLFH